MCFIIWCKRLSAHEAKYLWEAYQESCTSSSIAARKSAARNSCKTAVAHGMLRTLEANQFQTSSQAVDPLG